MSGYPYQQPLSQQPHSQPASGNPFAEQVNPYAAPQAMGFQPVMPAGPPSPVCGDRGRSW